jgi:hypothetical protein
MRDCKIITHESFNRVPTAGAPRRGRLPKTVARIDDARRVRRSEVSRLRAWAAANGLPHSVSIDDIRARKREQDALDRLMSSTDRELWQRIRVVASDVISLCQALSSLQETLLERHRREIV